MKKLRRSTRLIDMTQYLLSNPHKLIPLTFFAERYDAAKSSISEDLTIIKELFESEGVGLLKTVAGAAGGVKYIPKLTMRESKLFMDDLCRFMEGTERLLPGGYLYMSDILGDPVYLKQIGKIFASIFSEQTVDVVITVETKGIPLAFATASYLNVPVVIVRRDSKITEGSVVSINYVSGSSKRIQTMSLARRALKEKSKVLIIDDFMKAGGTVRGMIDLLQEFEAEVVGIGVFAETSDVTERLVDHFVSLAKISEINNNEKRVKLQLGNFLEKGGMD